MKGDSLPMQRDLERDTSIKELILDTVHPVLGNLLLLLGASATMFWPPFIAVGIPCMVLALVFGLAIKGFGAGVLCFFLGIIALVLFGSAHLYMKVGWIRILLGIVDDEEVSFSMLFQSMPWFLNFALTALLVSVASTLGNFLLLVPGLFIATRAAFAIFLAIEEDLGPIQAVMRSNELVTGYSWQVFAVVGPLFAIDWICNLIPIVGPFVFLCVHPIAICFFDMAMARLYRHRMLTVG